MYYDYSYKEYRNKEQRSTFNLAPIRSGQDALSCMNQ